MIKEWSGGVIADTFFTGKKESDVVGAPLGCDYPGALLPWRLVPHVLCVATFQIRHPVIMLILMEINDCSFYCHRFIPVIVMATLTDLFYENCQYRVSIDRYITKGSYPICR
jgi:hypothetical protein